MNLSSKRKLKIALLITLFTYFGVLTWNLRTGFLDRLAGNVGLEVVGWVLKPGMWTANKMQGFLDRYIFLLGVREENELLRERIDRLTREQARLEEDAAEAIRLRRLLSFAPPERWDSVGGRIIAQRLGPTAVLETVVVDRGSLSGVRINTPVVTPQGVIGRIYKKSLTTSIALLLTDPNSRIAVRGRTGRSTGILSGRGPGRPLSVNYVPLNAALTEGELLITSGLAEIFPKGLPIARVTSIERSEISLFQEVEAEPLVDMKNLEEVLLLSRLEQPLPVHSPTDNNATAPADNATAEKAAEGQAE